MYKILFGIDLGTTYSCISYVDESSRPVVIDNIEGSNITPSVVNFANATEVVVGQSAKEYAIIEPEVTCQMVKRLMGQTDFAISCYGKDISPEEVSAYILRKIAQDAEEVLGSISVKNVVITCPAYFGTAERTATKNAGNIAGLNVMEIISEPTAAAIYYGCTKQKGKKTIMVYDLGGGTFDVTIMSIQEDKIEVICADGNNELGGKDWDEAVMSYLANKFMDKTGFMGDFTAEEQQELRDNAEKIKKLLSSKLQADIVMNCGGKRCKVGLDRSIFDEITAFLLQETISRTDTAIEIAKDKGYSIDEILMVGGSTRMPQVKNILIEKYGIEPKILEPDEAVAKGAAIYANMLMNGYKTDIKVKKQEYKESTNLYNNTIGPQIITATTKSFALRFIDEADGGKLKCQNLIIKNQPMPEGYISSSETFYTYEANQTQVELMVYESDFMSLYYDEDSDYELGHVVMKLDGNLPRHSPIEVTFQLNREGILEVTGLDKINHQKAYGTMKAKGIMDQEQVKNLKEKSKMVTVRR